MIIAEQKPIDEIKSYLKGCRKVLVLGCGTCGILRDEDRAAN